MIKMPNRDLVLAVMREAETASFRYPTCEYRVYIDTDGDVGYEEWPAGDRGWYQWYGDYDREYIHTFSHQCYEILWDYWFNGLDEFYNAFQQRFAVNPKSDLDLCLYDEGKLACEENGIPLEKYEQWMYENETEAIDCMVSETDYDYIIDLWEEEMERREAAYNEMMTAYNF